MPVPFKIGSRSWTPGRVFCIGKNYGEHIKELGDEPGDCPVVFMKPPTSLVPVGQTIRVPAHGNTLHHEVEVVVLIGREGKDIAESQAASHIVGITLGIDLTLRDVQSDLKKKGMPWELAKAFDQSAPIGSMVSPAKVPDLADLFFTCAVNGQQRQKGNTGEMLFPIPRIIQYLSTVWALNSGDLIYTGTPSGVGLLQSGDTVTIESDRIGQFSWELL